jgi:hypothetical protein
MSGESGMSSELLKDDHQEPLPQVFIGSSSAALKLANRIGEMLGDKVKAEVWDTGIFEPGDDILDGLLRRVSLYDFAILVLSGDDITSSKGTISDSPRDNVIFELGLFMGVRGRRRAFVIITPTTGGTLKLPTDLAGNKSLRLDPKKVKDDMYLRGEIAKIRSLIEERFTTAALSLLPSTGLAFGYFNNFLVPVGRHLSCLSELVINDKPVNLRKQDYELRILVPTSLEDAGVEGRNFYVKETGLLPFAVRPEPRGYDFFVYPEAENGHVRFADYPTTLRSSLDAIRLTLREGALGERAKEQELMEQQESRNFVNALKRLLKTSDAVTFRNKITFQYVNRGSGSET